MTKKQLVQETQQGLLVEIKGHSHHVGMGAEDFQLAVRVTGAGPETRKKFEEHLLAFKEE